MLHSLWNLRTGDILELSEGDLARVLMPTEDGRWIAVQYERVPDQPSLVGSTDLLAADEIAGVISSVRN